MIYRIEDRKIRKGRTTKIVKIDLTSFILTENTRIISGYCIITIYRGVNYNEGRPLNLKLHDRTIIRIYGILSAVVGT